MRKRIAALVTAAVCTGLLSSAAGTAGAAVHRAPSDAYCSALTDYYTVAFTAAFASRLAEAFGDDSTTTTAPAPTSDEIRATFYLALAPKLERVTKVMATSGPKVLRKGWGVQQKLFASGVTTLKDAGLTDAQLEAIADAKLDSSNDISETDLSLDNVPIDKTELLALAKDFAIELARAEDLDPTPAQATAFSKVGSECGVFPNELKNCEKLITPTEASAILGEDATRTDDADECEYEGPDPSSGLQSAIGVETYDGTKAFTKIVKQSKAKNQDVPGVGDEAVALENFALNGHVKTCGKTLVAKGDDQTVVVGLCLPNDEDVPIKTLTGVTKKIFARL